MMLCSLTCLEGEKEKEKEKERERERERIYGLRFGMSLAYHSAEELES